MIVLKGGIFVNISLKIIEAYTILLMIRESQCFDKAVCLHGILKKSADNSVRVMLRV